MRTRFLSSSAATAIVALSIAPLAPPVEARIATVTAPDIELAAAPIGAIPLAFLRNQLTFCSLICPFIVQGAVTVPIGVAEAPGTFLQTLFQTGNLAGSLGAAASAVTLPADAAAEGIIGNDLNLVLPKAQNTLEVAVVQLMDVFSGQTTPGAARNTILAALDQPPGVPTVPVGAHGLLQVATVEAINVVSAVAFQAFETGLLGVVQAANATATTLASTHSVRAAIVAGMDSARTTLNTARNQVSTAVTTAITNIRAAAGHPVSAAVKAQRQVGHGDKAGSGVAHRPNGVHSLHRGRHAG
ncbi:hypothetical protein FHT40_000090 [Mycolicibacterium sp. BK556]|uniref:hypothetical protein n=1 Tax=unclassified Mycolicibacterium TaxID=2636767 RepID=UPI00160A9209|nr:MULTISPECIES: hypothetical protein [unclassified Mycolicibacterium]MBB3600457.1 hypothetical protein [Mycolicibacterium sp. BK556]MBB3630209.1 hypothetical protein [Mycolicibacterium sp. BK607]